MNDIFRDLLDAGLLVYLDDILIYKRTWEEQVRLLREVLQRLRQHQLYAKLKKCEFAVQKLVYLGHIVDVDEIKVDPAKLQVIQKWPRPEIVQELQSFVGLVGYYWKFVQGFSRLVVPLTNLLQSGSVWD